METTAAESNKEKKTKLSLLLQITTAKFAKKLTRFTLLLLFSGFPFLVVPRLHRIITLVNLLCQGRAHKQSSAPPGGGDSIDFLPPAVEVQSENILSMGKRAGFPHR